MNHKTLIIVIVLALIIIFNAFYIIGETEQVIITQFGEPLGDGIKEAGLKVKIPFIQIVHSFEKRTLEWDGTPQQIPTSDKRYIWLDTFARWRIENPLKFYESTRTETAAHSRLDDIISGTTRDVISSTKLIDIVRDSNREMKFTLEYEASTLEELKREIIKVGRSNVADSIFAISAPQVKKYGIELVDVQIKRLNYVNDVREKVYDRMISERQKIAAKYRSEGEGQAAEILGKMRRELDQIESEAYRTAQEIKGKADARAIQVYADAYNNDPDFYEFQKTLETYKQTIDKKNTLIMGTDSEYYKFLKRIDK
ncbi:MAG TPA: protease modulator HflC [Candidatus Cloacimonas sp.]|jgi:membrane protease subunit HflC|nr:modulator of FtsH protease HflC [Candidatus Cloacimonadota bacterium]HCX72219.1 protease modulator HflC [Candidatus Cloacimonas sp.]